MNYDVMGQLKTELGMLKAEKAATEDRIGKLEAQMMMLRKEAYPHKEGDVIVIGNKKCRVASVCAWSDDVVMMVNWALPSGGWSKKESYYWGEVK